MTETENNNEYQFNRNEKIYVLIAMLGSIIGFIPSLAIYLLKKEDLSAAANYHIKEMLNFQIVMLCICAVLFLINIIPILGTLICAILFPFVFLYNLIVVLIATIKAFDYKPFKYPITHEFI